MSFVDWEKAFDNVSWNKLFGELSNIGLKYKEKKMSFNRYKKQVAILRVEKQKRQENILKGARQGCSLSPLLFNIYREEAVKEIKEKLGTGITIRWERIGMLRFVDDIVFLAENKVDLENVLSSMGKLLGAEYGLKINMLLTKQKL